MNKPSNLPFLGMLVKIGWKMSIGKHLWRSFRHPYSPCFTALCCQLQKFILQTARCALVGQGARLVHRAALQHVHAGAAKGRGKQSVKRDQKCYHSASQMSTIAWDGSLFEVVAFIPVLRETSLRYAPIDSCVIKVMDSHYDSVEYLMTLELRSRFGVVCNHNISVRALFTLNLNWMTKVPSCVLLQLH